MTNEIERIEQWAADGQFAKISEALCEIFYDEVWGGVRLSSLWACSDEEPEFWQQLEGVLLNDVPEWRNSPEGQFWSGCLLAAKGKNDEAKPLLEQVADGLGQISRMARELLADIRASELEASLRERYEDAPMDMDISREYLQKAVLHRQMPSPDRIEGDSLYFPNWQIQLRPEIEQITTRGAILNFYLDAPQWGKSLFECSVGMGNDPMAAMGMASGGFLFSFMQGIGEMEGGSEPVERFETQFGGQTHRWRLYISNVVGMGESPQLEDIKVYWELLREGVLKRLGNQKLCYVKVYAANSYGQITGECRIDDVPSQELGAMVAEVASGWKIEQFASHKVFFFIRQEEETITPYPYWGEAGYRQVKAAVKEAARTFAECCSNNLYDDLPKILEDKLGDPILAAECFSFLPEICAENAFSEVQFSELISLSAAKKWTIECTKSQLMDYGLIARAIFELFQKNAFGSRGEEIHRILVGCSATYNAIRQMEKSRKNADLSGAKMLGLQYQMGEHFQLR
ncbi:MAG: hypothetical protein HFE45_08570 [Oscillospiraceae bacterium]|jgi:hypothetical protein|nr:hypothetical protein [Oscillospiraceae bacterium]